MSAVWNCPRDGCGAANQPSVRVCEFCGYERAGAVAEPTAKSLPPAYRVFPDKTLVRSRLTDVCDELDSEGRPCGKTVAEHIAEFKAHGRRIASRVMETR